jgi:hypothetical protein
VRILSFACCLLAQSGLQFAANRDCHCLPAILNPTPRVRRRLAEPIKESNIRRRIRPSIRPCPTIER